MKIHNEKLVIFLTMCVLGIFGITKPIEVDATEVSNSVEVEVKEESIVEEDILSEGKNLEEENVLSEEENLLGENTIIDVENNQDIAERYKGWKYDSSSGYYFFYDNTGKIYNGWILWNEKWYYLDGNNEEHLGAMVSDCKKTISGFDYFFDKSGAMQTGWIQRDGGWYYANRSGEKATGWQCIRNRWYYLDAANEEYPGMMISDCMKVIGNATYFFEKNGSMKTGWNYESGRWYYNDSGSATGWRVINNKWYYLDGGNEEYPGAMISDCKKTISGIEYFFDKSGAMQTGWIQRDGGWYFANGSGGKAIGWQCIGNRWYYLDAANEKYPGMMVSNCTKVIGNATYFFERSGSMKTGWNYESGHWYYNDGGSATGWRVINNKWYYLDGDNEEYPGAMVSDCKKTILGIDYFFNKSGAMQTGWIQRDGGWYFANGVGKKVTGWQCIGNRWYYLDAANEEYQGMMVSNTEKEINGNTYYFSESGAMKTGWLLYGKNWYWLETSGIKGSGWKLIGGVWYYLNPVDGNRMVSNGWSEISGKKYYFVSDGGMAQNWKYIDNKWYYLGADGAMKTGWQWIQGFWYYFYTTNDSHGGTEGVMAKNTIIDGYKLSGSGAMYTGADLEARKVLDRIGWNLSAAFNWSASLPYVNYSNSPSPGSESMAMYGFQNGVGDCYVMAATFYYMAKALGYDAHQMAGYVPLLNGGMGVHSWVEIDMNGSTYVFDPDFTKETGRNGYQIYYGMSGTWRYSNYYRMN